jgi:hypothetical protein
MLQGQAGTEPHFAKTTAHTGAVTLIQCFGRALTKSLGREALLRAGLPRKANPGPLDEKGIFES